MSFCSEGHALIKKILFWVIYLCLAGASLLFLEETLKQFNEGATYFQQTKSHMSVTDIPTLTFCFEDSNSFVFGENFTIELGTQNLNSIIPLNEGVNKIDQGIPHDIFLRTMKVRQFDAVTARICFKISPMTKKGPEHQNLMPNTVVFELMIHFYEDTQEERSNHPKPPKKATLYITSEENAYGVTLLNWFEGEVEPYTLLQGNYNQINVQVKEIHHIPDHCQQQSYYLCLANKLSKATSCSNRTCSIITLPTNTTFIDVEECKDTEDFICNEDALLDLHLNDDICKGTKPCVVKEYFPKEVVPAIPWRDEIFHILVYMVPPASSHGERVTRPHKTIYEEQYILSDLQLIGTFGGTLGLMIGFSFMGSIVSISEFASGLIQFIKRNRKRPD